MTKPDTPQTPTDSLDEAMQFIRDHEISVTTQRSRVQSGYGCQMVRNEEPMRGLAYEYGDTPEEAIVNTYQAWIAGRMREHRPPNPPRLPFRPVS